MEVFQSILIIGYVVIFFIAVFISLKFEMGEENKDERGKSISNKSYGVVFPLIPLGFLLIELYERFINQLDYDTYKLAIWFLISGLLILHGIMITVVKRKY